MHGDHQAARLYQAAHPGIVHELRVSVWLPQGPSVVCLPLQGLPLP
jgi:hypothetical protein